MVSISKRSALDFDVSRCDQRWHVGVGIADCTGPAAEVVSWTTAGWLNGSRLVRKITLFKVPTVSWNMCKRTAAPILFPCIVPGSAELIDSCEVMMGYADNNHKTAGIHMRHLARLRSSTHPPAGWLSVKGTVITVAVETAIISIIFHHWI